MQRRHFLAGAAALAGCALAPRLGLANVPTPFTFDLTPPMDSREKYIAWGVSQRGEDPKFLGEHFDRFVALVRNEDIWDIRHKRAFLLTPREKFVLPQNLGRAYVNDFLDIGFGVTISGPHIVGRMTSNIDPKQGEKVLEVGTGSGYQSAYLSHLTDQVYTIEIIKPLSERTRGIYDALIKDGYGEFSAIHARNADGYYGWVNDAAAPAATPSPAATAAATTPSPAAST
ncbi:MAG: protein-L-isoaspartate O-methyltransferase, partial [Roseiarcus sp.]